MKNDCWVKSIDNILQLLNFSLNRLQETSFVLNHLHATLEEVADKKLGFNIRVRLEMRKGKGCRDKKRVTNPPHYPFGPLPRSLSALLTPKHSHSLALRNTLPHNLKQTRYVLYLSSSPLQSDLSPLFDCVVVV